MKKNKYTNQTNLFDKYCIYDITNNTGKPYIAENHQNTNDPTSAKLFLTIKQTNDYILSNKWQKWAIVLNLTLNKIIK